MMMMMKVQMKEMLDHIDKVNIILFLLIKKRTILSYIINNSADFTNPLFKKKKKAACS